MTKSLSLENKINIYIYIYACVFQQAKTRFKYQVIPHKCQIVESKVQWERQQMNKYPIQ